MYAYDAAVSRWWIIRLMIAAEHQGYGYGRAAMHLLIDLIATRHGARQITTSYEPDNDVAASLYRSLGFRDTGEIDEGELVVILDLPEQPASGG
jgi:diamine N-acetyltransferase